MKQGLRSFTMHSTHQLHSFNTSRCGQYAKYTLKQSDISDDKRQQCEPLGEEFNSIF